MTGHQDYGPPWPQQYDPRYHQHRVQGQPWQQPPGRYPVPGPGHVQPYAQPQPRYQGYAAPAPYQGYPQYGQLQYAAPIAPKSTAAGLILGLLLPGVGCMYAGRVGIGILLLGIWLISIPLIFVLGLGFITGFCAWIASAILGYTMTRDWNAAHGIMS